ncbi:MAG: PTS fructose transporter subunit IIB [Micrococcales bacterium]
MKIVGVTSCITGIAHTYMAAEALEQAGKKLGHEVKIETQGSAGVNPLKQEVIDAADAVIFAVDLEVNGRDRFNGKPYVQVGVAKAISGATGLINGLLEAIENGTAPKVGDAAPAAEKKEASEKKPADKKGGLFGGLFGKK